MVTMLSNKIKMFAVLICCMNFVFAQCWDGSEDNDAAMAAFGGCSGAVAALGCDFVFGGTPISTVIAEDIGDSWIEYNSDGTWENRLDYTEKATVVSSGEVSYFQVNSSSSGVYTYNESTGDLVITTDGYSLSYEIELTATTMRERFSNSTVEIVQDYIKE